MWGSGIWRLVALISVMLLAACAGNETTAGTSASCDAGVVPKITVEIPATPVVEDRHLGIAELSAKDSLDKTVPALQRYQETLGMTAVNLTANIDGEVKALPHWGRWCAFIAYATVKVDWQTTVFLAHELIPGGCPDRAVREHEQKHVDLDRSLLPELQMKLEAALERLPQTTYWQSDGYSAMAELDDRAKQIARQVIDDFQKGRDADQLTIDTPAEYDRVAAVCGREAFPRLNNTAITGM